MLLPRQLPEQSSRMQITKPFFLRGSVNATVAASLTCLELFTKVKKSEVSVLSKYPPHLLPALQQPVPELPALPDVLGAPRGVQPAEGAASEVGPMIHKLPPHQDPHAVKCHQTLQQVLGQRSVLILGLPQ